MAGSAPLVIRKATALALHNHLILLVGRCSGIVSRHYLKHLHNSVVKCQHLSKKKIDVGAKCLHLAILIMEQNAVKRQPPRYLAFTRLRQMKTYLMQHTNEVVSSGPVYSKYFVLHYNEKNEVFQFSENWTDVTERENDLSGYFCIITSEEMTAKEALHLYKSRDTSEKLFRGDKFYLGDKSLRIYGDSSGESKIFVEFIALIIRSRIYNYLKDEKKVLAKRPDYMTVPAALKELDKIEMVRLTDNIYRLDHAITATQKTILNAFGLDANIVKHYAAELSQTLKGGK